MDERQAEMMKLLAQVLEDRLTLVVAEAMGEEIESILVREFESAREWEAMGTMLVSDDEASRHRQAVIRGSADYERARERVREWLRGIARGARLSREAA